jgi:methylglutaconyl-CoA hydratase
MADYRTITVERRGPAAVVSFAREEVRNAFDLTLLEELRRALGELAGDTDHRVLALTGTGTVFCAGADIAWMKKSLELDFDRNVAEARVLADCLYELHTHPLPTVAVVNGPAMGGGVGFIAACDIAIGAVDAFFAFSEVRIGVAPACIAPYVLRKVGERVTREMFLTGDRITAGRALELGLLNRTGEREKLWDLFDDYALKIAGGSPGAVAASKQLIDRVANSPLAEAKDYTARLIARLRASPEGQEGLSAFLEKREPRWRK